MSSWLHSLSKGYNSLIVSGTDEVSTVELPVTPEGILQQQRSDIVDDDSTEASSNASRRTVVAVETMVDSKQADDCQREETKTGDSDDYDDGDVDDDDVHNSTLDTKLDIDQAIERLGMGMFQLQVLFAAGLCFSADAMEILLLSFLAVVLQTEWELTDGQMDSIISTVFAGALAGTLVLSPLGDRIGRRPVFTLTATIIATFGMATTLCNSYASLLTMRFLVGFGVGGLTVPFDTLSEVIPTSHRGQNLLYIEFFWTAGALLVPLAAWWTLEDLSSPSWRLFVIVCAIPCILSAILATYLVPESPRWLLTQEGRHDEALNILRRAAARNGKDPFQVFPDGTHLVYHEEEQSHQNQSEHDPHDEHYPHGGSLSLAEKEGETHSTRNNNNTLGGLFSPQWRGLTTLLGGVFASTAFLYYGAILAVSLVFSDEEEEEEIDTTTTNSTTFEGANATTTIVTEEETFDFDYSAIFISSSAEFLGLILVLMTVDRWGRVATQTWTYLLGSLSCLLLGLVDFYEMSEQRNVLIALAFSARMFMMGGACTTWVSTSELLPTEIRTTGHGFANAMGRVGGFLSPYIISEGTSLRSIGVVIMAAGTVASFLCSKLPETKGKALGEAIVLAAVHATIPSQEEACEHELRAPSRESSGDNDEACVTPIQIV